MKNNTPQKYLKASKIQEHFWILQQLNRHDTAYNIVSVFKITGKDFDVDSIHWSLAEIVKRHEVFRTHFIFQDNLLYQVIDDAEAGEVDFHYIPLENFNTDVELELAIQNEIHQPFDLEKDRLVRVKIFEKNRNDYYLSIVFHHIIIDYQSKNNFIQELGKFYNIHHNGEWNFNELPLNQYSDYCKFHNQWLMTEEAATMFQNWKDELKSLDLSFFLPNDIGELEIGEPAGNRKYFQFDADSSLEIENICKENSINSFTFLLSIYFVFLYSLSGHENIVIGVPFTNRRKEEFKRTMGCFVNILPVILNFRDDPSFLEVLQRVRIAMLNIHRKQEIPFLSLNTFVEKETSLFKTGFTFDPPLQLMLDHLNVSNIIIEKEGFQLDLFLTFWKTENSFNGYFEYSNQRFNSVIIEQFIQLFSQIVASVIHNKQTKISQIVIVPPADLNFISTMNSTDALYEQDICIHEKFEMQVSETPDAVSLIFNDQTLNYGDLSKHSNNLANYLISSQVMVEDVLAVCLYRSFEMMIAIFGILKAGAAYMPINPNDPTERLDNILRDGSPKFILTSKAASRNLAPGHPLLFLDDLLNHPLCTDFTKPKVNVTSHNLAYIIYTSGSTGIPKGVMIEHHSVLNRLLWMQKKYPIGSDDTLLLKTSITFDVSVWELFWWSFNGSKLCILPQDWEKDPEILIRTIHEYSISTIHFVPSMFNLFLEKLNHQTLPALTGLKYIFLSGEALLPVMVNYFNQLRSPEFTSELVNLYGPTEATVDVSYYNCPLGIVNRIYIGKPIDNTKLFIINSKHQMLPVGITGELIIAGVNLARGYLNKSEKDNKFFEFQCPDGKKMRAYKTGDLAQICSNGEIFYVGRIDSQVKIRGIRIELGEVESKIRSLTFVSNCAIIIDGAGDKKHLIAYVCLKSEILFAETKIKDFLKVNLPDYMIPSYIIIMDHLPLSANGKLNKKFLPLPNKFREINHESVVSSKLEMDMSHIWTKLLEIENIRVNDNFFDLGGNSLLTIKLGNEIKKVLNIVVAPMDIFQYPNIRAICNFIQDNQQDYVVDALSNIELRTLKRKQSILKNIKIK